jgi:hypothetical protein
MEKREASIPEMKNYFNCPGRPTSNPEMMEFWKSLTDEEKTFYKQGIAEILDLQKPIAATIESLMAE